jgi:addiction module RelE/StbE family toxin
MTSSRFSVRLTVQAERDLKRLRPWTDQVTRLLLVLEEDPYRGHSLSGSLRDTRSLEFSLKGGGEYRAVYVVHHDQQVCVVFLIGPHENIYDKAERRLDALRRSGQI